MKKYALAAAVLAFALLLSPAALADYETNVPTVGEAQEDAGGVMGRVVEVIVGETAPGEAGEDAELLPAGSAPVAENQEIETYRGVSIGGRLTARDTDSSTLRYELTTPPMKGELTLSDDGYFVYTPAEGRKGRDYFGFRVTDESGNCSQEGTVIIKLLRQRTDICYSDLVGSGTAYSATLLAENGVFIGERVGGDYVFHPDAELSRGEFLSMCMVLSGDDVLNGVTSTGFLDDESIETWLKPYVSTALMQGYIHGVSGNGGASFQAGDGVCLRDACAMLNSVLGVTDVVSVSTAGAADDVPQEAVNLLACGVLDAYADGEAVLTRADGAELLANALCLLRTR